MTSADAAHRRSGAVARSWRGFRRWRRSRPFWGGLFSVLSGLQIFGSTQLTLGEIQLKVGLQGFLSYVIPVVLILCGLLIWFTPSQRVFYGVIAAVVALYSLIGVNLGGFFIGMLLGIIGGALAVAWTPLTPAGAAAEEQPGLAEGEEQAAEDGSPEAAPDEEYAHGRHEATVDELFTGPLTDVLPRPVNPLNEPAPGGQRYEDEDSTQRIPVARPDDEWPDQPPPDQPPPDQPPPDQPPPDQPPPAQPPPDQPPSEGGQERDPGNGTGPLPRRTPRLFVITLIPLLLTAVALGNLRGTMPARAAPPVPYPSPCPTGSASASAKAKPAPSSSAPAPTGGAAAAGSGSGTTTSAPPSPKPSASPSASPTSGSTQDGDGNVIGDVVDGIGDAVGDLLGIGDPTPSPSATPSTDPAASPSAASPSGPGPSASEPAGGQTPADPDQSEPAPEPTRSASATPKPTSSADCVVVKAKELDASGVPAVQNVPDQMTGSKLTLAGFSFDGVTGLTTGGGDTIRVLQFSMDKAVTEDFQLRVPGPSGRTISLTSSALTVQRAAGDAGQKVQFYCSRFSGKLNLVGVEIPIPLTFTPDSPPPLTLPEMVFTDIDIQLVFVDSDQLLAPDLHTSLLS